jgi:hypothetical protein
VSFLRDPRAALPDRQGGAFTGQRLAPSFHRAKHDHRCLVRITLAWLALFAAGCSSHLNAPGQPPTMLASPRATSTASPPPTPTPSASPSPTQQAPVAVGELLYAEAFDSPQGWDLLEATAGAASIHNGALVLSVHTRATSILQPSPVEPLGDFYAEVELRPAVCSPGDEFGLVIRLTPSGGHYRVSLLCEGALRLLRVQTDQTNALTGITPSGAIIPGAAGTNLLAISAQGTRLRVFVNRQPVVEDRDARFGVGGIGFFARAGAARQTTVAFDNLAVYALAATPTPAP